MKLDACSPQIAPLIPVLQIPTDNSKRVNLLTETLQKKESFFPPTSQIKPFLKRQYKDLKNELDQFLERKQIKSIQGQLPRYPLSQVRNAILNLSPQAKIGIASLFSSLGALFGGLAASHFFSAEQASKSKQKNKDPNTETVEQQIEDPLSEPIIPANSENKIFPFCLPEEKNVPFNNRTTPLKQILDPLKFLPKYTDFTNLFHQNLTNPESFKTSSPLVKINNQFPSPFQCSKWETPSFKNSSLVTDVMCAVISQIGNHTNPQPLPLTFPPANPAILSQHPHPIKRNIWTALFGVSLITAAAVGLISKYFLTKGPTKKSVDKPLNSKIIDKAPQPKNSHVFPPCGEKRTSLNRRNDVKPTGESEEMRMIFEKIHSLESNQIFTYELKSGALVKDAITLSEIKRKLKEHLSLTLSVKEVEPNCPFTLEIPNKDFFILVAPTWMLFTSGDQVKIYPYESNFQPNQRREIRKNFVKKVFNLASPNTKWTINIAENGEMTASQLKLKTGISKPLSESASPEEYLEFIKKCPSYVRLKIGLEEKVKNVGAANLIDFIDYIQNSTKPQNIHVLKEWEELEIIRPGKRTPFSTNVIYSELENVLLIYYDEGDVSEANSDSNKEDYTPFAYKLEIIDFRKASAEEKVSLIRFITEFYEGINQTFEGAKQKGKEISKGSSSEEEIDSTSKKKEISSEDESSSTDEEELH